MDIDYGIECQFVSAGYNLKQWDLVKTKPNSLQFNEYDIYKSTDTEFLIPVESSIRQPFTSVVFDPSGTNIASLIANNQELYFTTLKEGMGFKKILLKNPQCINYFGLEGNFLAVGCIDSLYIVDCKLLKVLEIFPLPKSDNQLDKITSIDSSFDSSQSNLIVIGTERGIVYTFTCFNDKKIANQICTNNFPITIIRLSPHSYNITATAHSNGDVNIFDLYKKELIHSLFQSPSPKCICMDFSPFRDDLFGVGNKDGVICIFDLKKLTMVGQLSIQNSMVTGLIFLRDGINLIIGDDKGQIHIFNLHTLMPCRSYRLHSSTLLVLVLKTSKFSQQLVENVKGRGSLSTNKEERLDRANQPCNKDLNMKILMQNPNYLNPDLRDYTSSRKLIKFDQRDTSSDIISPLRATHSVPNELQFKTPIPYNETSPFVDKTLCTISVQQKDDNLKASPLTPSSRLLSQQKSSCNNEHCTVIMSKPIENSKKYPIRNDENGKGHELNGKITGLSILNEYSQSSQENLDVLTSKKILQEDNIERNYLNSILDSHTNDIKDFICQQMITLMSELTRNVTNLQMQIVSLDSKIGNIQFQVNDIKKNMSQNSQFFNY